MNKWTNIVLDDWNLDENHLESDSNCNIVNLEPPINFTMNDK